MKSSGQFIVVDEEITGLLRTIAEVHPVGNRHVLRFLLRFYVDLARIANASGVAPLKLLEELAAAALSKGSKDSESRLISEEMSKLKEILHEIQAAVNARFYHPPALAPVLTQGSPSLAMQPSLPPEQQKDYREIRLESRPRIIVF